MIRKNLFLLKAFALIAILFLVNESRGIGQYDLDSLEISILKQENDSNKVKTIQLLSNEYSKVNLRKALFFANQMEVISQELNYIPGKIDALVTQSEIYYNLYEYDSASAPIQSAIELSRNEGELKRFAKSNAQKGKIIYRKQGPFDAIPYFLESYNIYKQLGDSLGLADVLNGLGVIYMRQSKYESAISYYIELIQISEKKGYDKILGKGYLNLGISYLELGDYNKAEPYLKKSLQINEKYNELYFLSLGYNNLGALAYKKNKFSEATDLYQEALKICEKINNTQGIASAYNNIGIIYMEEGKNNQAIESYKKAIELYKEIDIEDGFIVFDFKPSWTNCGIKLIDTFLINNLILFIRLL